MHSFSTSPITVAHIGVLQDTLGLNATDMAWLLGASAAKWSSIRRHMRLQPDRLADPCHALILRWMVRHPTASPTLYAPAAGEFLARLRDTTGPITAKHFALSLGWDASAGHRWLRGSPIGPAGRQALSLINALTPDRLADNWGEWRANAHHEAALRNIDINRALGWTPARNHKDGSQNDNDHPFTRQLTPCPRQSVAETTPGLWRAHP